MANRDTVRLLLERLGKPWSLVRHVEDRPGSRPALCDGRQQDRGPRLATADVVRGRARRRRSIGSSPTNPGGGPPDRATGTPITSASTDRDCGPPADAGRRHRGRRATWDGRSSRRWVMPRSRARRPDRLDAHGFRPRCARVDRRTARPRPARGRRQRRGLDRCRRLCARPRTGAAPERRGGPSSLPRPPQRAASTSVQISTNEVFDGRRGIDRSPTTRRPAHAGQSVRRRRRLAGEDVGGAAYREPTEFVADRPHGVAVRAARQRLPDEDPRRRGERAAGRGEPLKVVGDEFGSPTFTHDVAEAIAELLGCGATSRGVHHVVNAGVASRADWARELFRQARPRRPDRGGAASTWPRASTPPAWGVLEPTPLPSGEPMRPWQAGPRRLRPAAPATAESRPPDERRRASAIPGVRYGTVQRLPTSGVRSVSSGVRVPSTRSDRRRRRQAGIAPRFVQANLSTSVGGGPARPPSPPTPARPLDRRSGSGVRRSRRPAAAAGWRRRPAGRDPRACEPTAGSRSRRGVAHGFMPLEPLDLVYLVTNEYDGSDEARVRLGRPARGRPLAASRARRTDGRSCRSATARTHRSGTSWCALRHTRYGRRLPRPHRRHRTSRTAMPMWLDGSGPSCDWSRRRTSARL